MQPDVVKGFWADGNAEWYFVHVNLVARVHKSRQEEDRGQKEEEK